MSSSSVCYWKRLWRWTTADNISEEEIWKLLSENNVAEQLRLGLASYRPLQTDKHADLQKKHPDQTQLLSVTQTLQKFLDLDTLQTWDVIMHYLCDDSYGTPADALKNVAFLDARTSRLLPHVWHFYRSERLFLLKLLKYIIEFKDDETHKYHNEFTKLIDCIGIQEIKTSLLKQFEEILKSSPPARMPHFELGEAYFKQQWVLYNLREQLELLQILLLVVDEVSMSDGEFISMFQQFKKHDFGKRQLFSELLEERHRESCLRIMFSEIALFLVAVDARKIKSVACWVESTREEVETELRRLQQQEHHSALLLAWMLIALSSDQHTSQFESNYAQYGIAALNLQVFKFLHLMITNLIFMDNSKCASLCRMQVYQLLNDTCDKFDGDGSISLQPGVMELCGELLSGTQIADKFWRQLADDEPSGVVSLWNTALEYFPYNFCALSVLSEGLARAGKHSVKKLLQELDSLPVFTEMYRPNSVPLANICLSGNEVVIGKDYYLLNNTYKVTAGSRAAVMERNQGTFIHFRTPISYWTVFNYEVERVLDRRVHNQQEIEAVLDKIWEGTKLLKSILQVSVREGTLPRALVAPSEAALDVLLRFFRLEAPPLPLLVACLDSATALARLFPARVHARLINTGLLPRLSNQSLGPTEYASGASFDSATVGAYLVGVEQRSGNYQFLSAYIDLVCTFSAECGDERIQRDVYLPGVVLVLREVFPNLRGWRYASADEKRALTGRCVTLLSEALLTPAAGAAPARALAHRVALHSLLYTENAAELLNIVAVGDQNLQQMMCDESNWVSGPGRRYIATVQRCLSMLMQLLRLKREAPTADVSPLEHLIFAQKQREAPRIIPSVTTYINHAFNRHLPPLTCRLLNRFASEFQMSLFACLDMTAYQARVLFLERLREPREPPDLKVAVLLFVATCVGKQPGLTEAFFDMRRGGGGGGGGAGAPEDHSDGVLAYMADYLATVKSSTSCLQSPLLNCIMALFHALWKNNMQVLIRDLTENPTFWEHLTSPLFNEIQPELKAYAQTFNILGIEVFLRREKIDPNLKKTLELFFNTDKKHLDKWIEYIFSFQGRYTTEEVVDEVPTWLGLLTSWKDFTTIFCKCLPIPLNIAHKSKMVSPCMKALLTELEEPSDSRLVIVLAELYVIMLASWQDDCFDNRKANVKQIDELLNYTRMVYESLHPRAKRAILSIGTVAISTLDYEIKANATIAHSIILSVTNINSTELDKLYGEMKDQKTQNEEEKLNGHVNKDIAPIVLSLAMLEQCLDLYDDMFSSLAQWFQSTRFVNKLLCCLNMCLQSRKHYNTSLAALRCLTAYARGPFSADLLLNDVDQFLWMQLMPPRSMSSEAAGRDVWRPEEWWRVYASGLDFVSMMVMRHGQFFARDAITFIGVHAESVVEAVLLPRTEVRAEALDVCVAALGLVHQLVRYECRWRMENVNALTAIMVSFTYLFIGVHAESVVEAVLLPRTEVRAEALDVCVAALGLVHQLVRYECRWRMENVNALTAIMVSFTYLFIGVHAESVVEAVLLPRTEVRAEALDVCVAALGLIHQLVRYECRWRMENVNALTAIMVSFTYLFIGVHAESVVEAVLLPRTEVRAEALDVCFAALGLVHQLVRYECRWRMENVNALTAIMVSFTYLFIGVHAESVVEAVLLPRTEVRAEALDVCVAALGLVHQLVRYECRWRMENVNALTAIMRSLSVCVYQCVSLALRSRLLHQLVERPGALDDQPSAPSQKVARTLNRILEIIHTAVLCLLAFSPPLLSLLAGAPLDLRRWQPLVELHFGAPNISSEPYPQLSFGTLLSVICLLTKSLNYTYHGEEASSPGRSRSPRALSARRRAACASPGDPPTPAAAPARRRRSESLTSVSSTTSAVTAPWLAAFDKCLVANALEATLTLLASQALLAIRDPTVASRDRQLVRRELCSELITFHDFVRKRILYFSPSRSNLVRSKLGIWPLLRDEEEARRVAEARRRRDEPEPEPEPEVEAEPPAPPPPPPPRRPAPDSMREFVLRKRYLESAREGFAAPVSHSTPAPDRKPPAKSKRVSWAESTREGEAEAEAEGEAEGEGAGEEAAPADRERAYSPLTDVQVNNDEDYFHFMSIVLLYICQSDL